MWGAGTTSKSGARQYRRLGAAPAAVAEAVRDFCVRTRAARRTCATAPGDSLPAGLPPGPNLRREDAGLLLGCCTHAGLTLAARIGDTASVARSPIPRGVRPTNAGQDQNDAAGQIDAQSHAARLASPHVTPVLRPARDPLLVDVDQPELARIFHLACRWNPDHARLEALSALRAGVVCAGSGLSTPGGRPISKPELKLWTPHENPSVASTLVKG